MATHICSHVEFSPSDVVAVADLTPPGYTQHKGEVFRLTSSLCMGFINLHLPTRLQPTLALNWRPIISPDHLL